ncbi:hypothetical protein D3C78_806830 [compost metagenome]
MGVVKVFDAQPSHLYRGVDQRPLQGAALQQVDHMACAFAVLFAMFVGMLQHVEIADQQEPAYSRARHAVNQCADMVQLSAGVVRRQCWQQANYC